MQRKSCIIARVHAKGETAGEWRGGGIQTWSSSHRATGKLGRKRPRRPVLLPRGIAQIRKNPSTAHSRVMPSRGGRAGRATSERAARTSSQFTVRQEATHSEEARA